MLGGKGSVAGDGLVGYVVSDREWGWRRCWSRFWEVRLLCGFGLRWPGCGERLEVVGGTASRLAGSWDMQVRMAGGLTGWPGWPGSG